MRHYSITIFSTVISNITYYAADYTRQMSFITKYLYVYAFWLLEKYSIQILMQQKPTVNLFQLL
jgi:hypothetical protein